MTFLAIYTAAATLLIGAVLREQWKAGRPFVIDPRPNRQPWPSP
jgi:hypothetical protein